MRWKMPNVAIVFVAGLLVATVVDTVLAADGGGAGVGGGNGGGGGGRHRGAATATPTRQMQDVDIGVDESPRVPAAVQCASCSAHEEIKSLSIELIKMSILNKLGMQHPPEFGGRMPPRVPTDLPPLQDLMRRYNNNDHGSSVVVLPHIRHQGHYETSGDGGSDMQSDEASASGYSAAAAAAAAIASIDNSNRYSGGGGGYGGGGYGEDDDDDDDYHVKTHKLIAFAQPHPTMQKLRNHYLLFFTFSDQTGQHRITEAILWVYRKRLDVVIDDAVVMIEVYRVNANSHPVLLANVKRVINTTEPGWVPIDLQKRKSDWFRSADGAKNLTLMVHAYFVNKNTTHGKTPFVTDARKRDDMTEVPYLEVLLKDGRRSRPKRNLLGLDCTDNSDERKCCRYPLTVDFDDFGWDWIIAPKRYEANYCSGECPMVYLQRYPHTHLTQLTNKTGMYPGTGLCCAPRKLSALAMLYFDQDYKIIYRMLPGMVVDRCGCS